MKRYVVEFANDRKNYYKDVPHIYDEFVKYSDKVINMCKRGIITSTDAVKMLASVDAWELSHEEWKSRFNEAE